VRPVTVLTIAGLDPSGGAGVLADVRAIQHGGGYGLAVVTASTVQGDAGVRRWLASDSPLLTEQLAALDLPIDGIKVGMLGSAEQARVVAAWLARQRCPIVVDPVLSASRGPALADAGAREVLVAQVIPRATVVTPNRDEAARLGPQKVPMLVKGGHGSGDEVRDTLTRPGREPVVFRHPRVPGARRGTGCWLSSALALRLARGLELERACAEAIGEVSGLFGGPRLGRRSPLIPHPRER
jgi:hydroxymethylpyrimidine/phosphomethylpyrimidine kinase